MTDDKERSADVSYYLRHIEAYEKAASKWEPRARKIVARYMDAQTDENKRPAAQFNILWSNVQTLAPALYAKPPKPNIDRRQDDDDDLSRISSQVMERAVSYYVGEDLFDAMMQQVVLDRLLPGRGTSWVRYVPNISEEQQLSEDGGSEDKEETAKPELYGEDVIPDYVHWQDFGHSYGRTWQEVGIVWRKVPLSRTEAEKRFGKEKVKDVSFAEMKDGKSGDDDNKSPTFKAWFYEIWDKPRKRVAWLNKDLAKLLDEQSDPLKLRDFFPCPRPLYATLANDGLIPTPDYVLYQDQAMELDALTGRIKIITTAIKVVGVYDSTAEGVQRLLNEGVDNKLIAVENWAVFGEKGGLKGVIDLLPLQDILNTLIGLYEARDRVKQDLYEITGISDIIRGASNPNETATAQNIKGQFATLRLDAMQKDVARFARDIVRIMAEIIAEHFDIDTIKQVSGVKLLTEQEKAQLQAQMAQAQAQPPMQGQPMPAPAAPPIDDETQKLLTLPTWEQVEELLRNDLIRSFKVDIETDSTIKLDQDADRQARIELVTAAGGFLQQLASSPPTIQPLGAELLMFAMRGFKVGRDLEGTFKTQLDKIKQQAENPPEQADPEAAKMAAELESKKMEMEASAAADQQARVAEMQKCELDVSKEVQKAQADAQWKMQAEINRGEELRIKEKEIAFKDRELDYKILLAKLEFQAANDKLEADVHMAHMDAEASAEAE